jgi:Thioredoxin-like
MTYNFRVFFRAGILAIATVMQGWAQTPVPNSTEAFLPFEQWKAAVLAGDATALKAFYSVNPPAKVRANQVQVDASAEVSFWIALQARSLKVEIVLMRSRADLENIIFNASVVTGTGDGQTTIVADDQIWQKQGEQWRLRFATRTDAPSLKQPSSMNKDIYPAGVNAHAELAAAEERAAREHKRVLLVFGANWCYDCHVLDLAFQRPDLAPLLASSYEVVHIDLGPDEKKNADLVIQFDIPLHKGIPALAVAESDGKLVISQKNGEFENARGLTPESLLEFLNKWKPEQQ